MDQEDIDILTHQLVGGWALEYHILMTAPALAEIERRIKLTIEVMARGCADERERAAKIVEGYWPTGRASDMDAIAALIRRGD